MGCCSISHDKYGIRIDYNFLKKEHEAEDWGLNTFGENGPNSAFFEKLRNSSRDSPKNPRFRALNQEQRLLEEQRPNGIELKRNYLPSFSNPTSPYIGGSIGNSIGGEGNKTFTKPKNEFLQACTPERASHGQSYRSDISTSIQQSQPLFNRQNYHMGGNNTRQHSASPLNYSNSPVNQSRVVQVISPTREEQPSPNESFEGSFIQNPSHPSWFPNQYNYQFQQPHFSQQQGQAPATQLPLGSFAQFRSIPYNSSGGGQKNITSNGAPVEANQFLTPTREVQSVKNFSTIRVDPSFSSNGFSEEKYKDPKEPLAANSLPNELVKGDIFLQESGSKKPSERESVKNQSTNRTKAETDDPSEKETITLTINLLGDSIKDNFVLEKIMEIFPEACHLPSFDTVNNRVKFQIKTEEFERNPKLQELLRIAERKSAENISHPIQESFDCAESFVEGQNVSFSRKMDDTFGNLANDNRNIYPEYLHESFREHGRPEFLDTMSYEVRKEEVSQQSNFDLNLDESSELGYADSNPFRKDGGKRKK